MPVDFLSQEKQVRYGRYSGCHMVSGHRHSDNQTLPALVPASGWFAGYVP
jgi:hypothetical protein